MAKNYIINNSVIYTPSMYNLCSLERNESITLATPASLCFELLIKNQGEIISQEELLLAVWGERGMNVTQNTLHQNISLLRKSLSRLGINALAIQTIPRRGFMLSGDTVVIAHDEEYDAIPTGEKDKISNIKNIAAEIKEDKSEITGSAASPLDEEKKEAQDETKETELQTVNKPPKTLQSKWLVLRGEFITICICLLIIIIVLVQKYANSPGPFALYRKLPVNGDCVVFRSNDIRADDFFTNFIESNHIVCSDTRLLYITNYYPSGRISLITCINPLESTKKSYCTSVYYLK